MSPSTETIEPWNPRACNCRSASRMNSFLFVPLHRVAGAKCEVCLFIDFKSGIQATRGCISGVNIDLLGLCPVSPDANSTKLTRRKKRVGRGRTCRRYVYVIIVYTMFAVQYIMHIYMYIYTHTMYIYTYICTCMYIYMLCIHSTIQQQHYTCHFRCMLYF